MVREPVNQRRKNEKKQGNQVDGVIEGEVQRQNAGNKSFGFSHQNQG
jgi:hypothetical protein